MPEKSRPRLVTALIETFGFSPLWATIVAGFLMFLAAAALVWLWLSAPPRKLTISSGPPGSSFQRHAEAYKAELAKRSVTLEIIPSGGSADNLQRLNSPNSGVDVGFVQGGLVGDKPPPEGLVSLGSVANQPVWVFYRGTTRIARLSELAGRRIGVGAKGSGTHALALALLQANGITGAPTTLVEQAAEGSASDLLEGKLDAIVLMGEAASLQTLRSLTRATEVQLYHFTQADAYVRRIHYLNKITLPQGSLDFGRNIPAQDVVLVGPTVELVARDGLHSALVDVLLEAARVVHSKPGLLTRRDEFPAPIEREFTLSSDARRFYKEGMGTFYTIVPNFYLASLLKRALVVIVPLILVMIPLIRILPLAYRWSVQLRIFKYYRPLLRLERETQLPVTRAEADEMLARLDEIERNVNALKVPASFAYQFYALRGHVAFVRSRLNAAAGPT